MKKIPALILCLSMLGAVLCACSSPDEFSDSDNISDDYTRSTSVDTYNYTDADASSPTTYSTYSSEITDFSLKLFRNYYKLNADNGNSSLLAPASTAVQLGLLANGADEDTSDEIIFTLGSDLSLDAVNECSSYFKSRIEAVSKISSTEENELGGDDAEGSASTSYVKLENALLLNDTADVITSFMQTNANYYDASIFRFVFSDENSLTKVNNLFSDFSSSNILSELDGSGDIISITAADICDTWLTSYAETDVEAGTFTTAEGDEKTVGYMTSNESYLKTDNAQAVVKYAASTPLKFVAILPNEDITLEEYISDFTYLEFSNLLDSLDITVKATAVIPEFTISYSGTAQSLSVALEKSGLYTLFTDEAEFDSLTRTEDFGLDDMLEVKSTLTVNAAGIGGQSSNGDTAPISERTKELDETDVTVEFNRPFLFLIIDNESNIPVYIGTVENFYTTQLT